MLTTPRTSGLPADNYRQTTGKLQPLIQPSTLSMSAALCYCVDQAALLRPGGSTREQSVSLSSPTGECLRLPDPHPAQAEVPTVGCLTYFSRTDTCVSRQRSDRL